MSISSTRRCILPSRVLHRLARSGDPEARTAALEALEGLSVDGRFRLARAESAASAAPRAPVSVTFARAGGQPQRTIYDQQHSESQTPGQVVRTEGQAAV